METRERSLTSDMVESEGRSGDESTNAGVLNSDPTPIRIFETGEWAIDYGAREALYGGAALPLTKTEFRILATLAKTPGATLSNEEITQAVWGEWYSDYHHIHVHISRLRQKLQRHGADPAVIRNIHGVGYRFRPSE